MIKENQRLFNQLNVFSDGLIVYAMLPIAFWIRFEWLDNGTVSVPLSYYLQLGLLLTVGVLFTFAAFGLYRSFRNVRILTELTVLWKACALDIIILLSYLFLGKDVDVSRLVLALYLVLIVLTLSVKRIVLRKTLRLYRKKGYNLKHVLLLGSGDMACRYLAEVQREKDLGFSVVGYVAQTPSERLELPCLGGFDMLAELLERYKPDEVVSAVDAEDYNKTPQIISACEAAGIKLALIPLYADFLPSRPQFDELGGIPLMNTRRIPLDNWANAFCKRAMDILGSGILLLALSPVLLLCAIGVRISSPGPVLFRQERVGLGNRTFTMYKFRSMRLNAQSDTAWSSNADSRKTAFGAFLRKCSLDELPQLYNVLRGDMSLVGPRPELPHFVKQFREEIPRYMVKHQVRPGITGWAQVNDLRGDTSIRDRIDHDLFYIEHWSLFFDLKILLMTVFGGKFLNQEKLR